MQAIWPLANTDELIDILDKNNIRLFVDLKARNIYGIN